MCENPFLRTCEDICEQKGFKEGRKKQLLILLAKLAEKTLSVILAASSRRTRLEIQMCVCVLSTRDFCCLSDDWRGANIGSAHSSRRQPPEMCTLFFFAHLPQPIIEPQYTITTSIVADSFFFHGESCDPANSVNCLCSNSAGMTDCRR